MRNRTNVTPAVVASVPAVAPAVEGAAPAPASPFTALLAQSARTVAASGRRASVNASGFPAVDAAEFPAAVLAACEAVCARMAEPDAPRAMSIVAANLNKAGVRPGMWSTGAEYGNRSRLAGTAMWQRDGIAMVIARATAQSAPAATVEAPAAE